MDFDERRTGSSGALKRRLAPAHRFICHVAAPLRASQRRRRRLVGSLVGVLVAFPLVAALTSSMALVLMLFIPYIAGSLLLGGATGGVLDRPVASLDERQRNQRLTAVPEPYVTGASLGLVAGVTVAAATRAEEAMMLGIMLLAMLLLFGLPSMVLAWRLPDEADDVD